MGYCSQDALSAFSKRMRRYMWRVNGLMVVNTILAGILVALGIYGQRYRHHALIRFLFLGATTLFLPIISYVISTTGDQDFGTLKLNGCGIMAGSCLQILRTTPVLIWTCLVQIVGINACTVVASGRREGRSIGPPVQLLVQGIWTSYLASNLINMGIPFPLGLIAYLLVIFVPCTLIFAKILFKFYLFEKARRSFAFGRNPSLVAGYMKQWQDESQTFEPVGEHVPPPLIVMGEETQQVEKHPQGYCFRQGEMKNDNRMVTIDRLWQLALSNDKLLRSQPQLKYLCFSLALFKLLRCRLAGRVLAEAGSLKSVEFLFDALLRGTSDYETVFGVIVDELSFFHDYYYSALPISYVTYCSPIVGISISVLSIGYCLAAAIVLGQSLPISMAKNQLRGMPILAPQIKCEWICLDQQHKLVEPPRKGTCFNTNQRDFHLEYFGDSSFDFVPLFLLLALVMLAETREIVSFVCSNWTKVTLTCYYINRVSWQRSPRIQRWIGLVTRRRCKLTEHWDDRMNQCSLLGLQPSKTLTARLRRLLHLPDQKKPVPTAVKAAILDTLRSNNGCLSNYPSSLCQNQISNRFLWACDRRGMSSTILVWHIATSIFELRHPHTRGHWHPPVSEGHKITATYLSQYCVYLVAYSPELLPDDDEWSKSLYKAVKKDAQRILSGHSADAMSSEEEYEQLVALLSARSEHEVLKHGVRLGKQIVGEINDEVSAWRMLAGFWSETILFVAPSDNANGHAEAIARGGELITALWALLNHAGVVSRPSAAATVIV